MSNAEHTERFFLVLFQDGMPEDHLGVLNPSVFQLVQYQLDKLPDSGLESAEIDIWVESPGGTASVSYKLLLELRSRFSSIRAVVPDYAKSAATLLSIGADEIFMAPAAELGPLDVQVEHPDREGVRISGLDASRALGFLAQFAVDYIKDGGGQVFASTRLPRRDVVREFSTFAARFLEPLVAKLDPQLIHRAAQDLQLAAQYAVTLLELRDISDDPAAKEVEPSVLAEHLVENYPAHEYVISCDEARKMGLPVRELGEYDKAEDVKALFRAYQKGAFRHEDVSNHFIRILREREIDELFRKQNGTPGDSENPADKEIVENTGDSDEEKQPV